MRLFKRKGSPNWWVTWNDQNGKRHRRSSGTADRRLADAVAAKWVKEEFLAEHFGKKPEVPFAKALLRYAEVQKRDHSKHFKNVMRYLLKRQMQYFGKLNLSDIKPSLIRRMIDERLEEVRLNTVLKDVTVLKAILNMAHREELLDAVPPFPRMKSAPSRNRWLTDEELDRLVGQAAAHQKPIILFAVDTGGRLSEVLGLDWRNVDLANKRVTFVETKNGEDRTIPLCERALSVLTALGPKNSGPVFTFQGRAIKKVQTAFEKAREKAGLEDVHFHDLRHTFASRLVQGGVPLFEVMHMTGHKSMKMVQRYAHLAPDYQDKSIRVLNGSGHITDTIRFGGNIENLANPLKELERASGFEPPTSTLARL